MSILIMIGVFMNIGLLAWSSNILWLIMVNISNGWVVEIEIEEEVKTNEIGKITSMDQE